MTAGPANHSGTAEPSADAALFAACVAGDLGAFARLVSRHQGLVCAIAFSTVGDRALSEDVAQETFLALWNSRDRIRDPQKLASWLCNTARNLGRNAVRGRRTVALEDHHEVASDVTPFEQLAEQQQNKIVWTALWKLSDTYREPLVMYCRDGESLENVAIALGLSRDAVKQRVARGRTELKDNVERVERQLARSGPKAAFAAAVIAAVGAQLGAAQVAAAAGHGAAKATAGKGGWLGSWGLARWALLALFAIGVIVTSLLVLRSRHDAAGSARSIAGAPHYGKSAPSPHPASRELALPNATPDQVGDLRLEGLVVDDAGKPVADAMVTISTIPPTIVRTDEGGSFVAERLLPRSYRLTARHNELSSQTVALLVTETTEPIVLELRRGATLDVIVLDELSGRPVPGATVSVPDSSERASDSSERAPRTTDSHGKARIAGLVDDMLLLVRAPGFGLDAQCIKVPGDGVVFRQTIFLDAARTVTGILRDRAGKPIADVRVSPGTATAIMGMTYATTDATGSWAFSDLPPGSYVFQASAPGGNARSKPVDLIAHDATERVELVVEPGVKLAGRVVDAQQRPVPHALVQVMGHGDVTAGADGRFVIDGVEPGTTRLFASRYPDASPFETIEAQPGIDQADLVLTVRPSVIRGVVTADGEPVAGVQVGAMASDLTASYLTRDSGTTANDVTNAAGEFVLGPLPDDSYLVSAQRRSRTAIVQDVTPESITHARPGAPPLQMALTSGGTLIGSIVRADGGPVDGLSITLGTFEAGLSFSTPNPLTSATFRIEDVPAGTLVLAIAGDGVKRHVHPGIVVTTGKTTDLGTITIPTGNQLTGRVITKQGAPVPNALILADKHLMGDDRRIYSSIFSPERMVAGGAQHTRTDLQGRFRLSGLGDAPVWIMADSRALGRSEPVEIRDGTADLVMVVEPTSRVSGEVTSDGRPAAGARVIARTAKQVSFRTTTDDHGRYTFTRLGAGTYALHIGAKPMSGDDEELVASVIVAAGTDLRRDLVLGSAVELVINLDLAGVKTPVMGGVALVPGLVTASSLAELEKLGEPEQGQMQMVIAARGPTKVVFPRAKPGTFSACIVLGTDAAMPPPPSYAPAVSCFPAVITASPKTQTLSITPRLP